MSTPNPFDPAALEGLMPHPLNPYAQFAPKGQAQRGYETPHPLNPYAQFAPKPVQPVVGPGVQEGGEPGLLEEVSRGFQRGIRSVGADITGVKALGKELVGMEAGEDVAAYQQANKEIQQQYGATVGRIEDIDNAYEFAQWLAGLVGEQSVMIAGAMMSGGLGSILGRAVGKRVISKELADLALKTATKKWAVGGGIAGGVGFTAAVEGGGQYGEQIEAGVERQPLAAAAGGLAAGALEYATPALIAARFGLSMAPDLAKKLTTSIASRLKGANLATRMGANALLLGTSEGATEGAQELIALAVRNFADENYEALGPEGRSRLLNAVAGGFVMGGGIGALTPPTRESAERGEKEIDGYKPPPPEPPPPPTPYERERWRRQYDLAAEEQARKEWEAGQAMATQPEPGPRPTRRTEELRRLEEPREEGKIWKEGETRNWGRNVTPDLRMEVDTVEDYRQYTIPWKVVKDGEVSQVGVNAGEMFKKVQENLDWIARMTKCVGGP